VAIQAVCTAPKAALDSPTTPALSPAGTLSASETPFSEHKFLKQSHFGTEIYCTHCVHVVRFSLVLLEDAGPGMPFLFVPAVYAIAVSASAMLILFYGAMGVSGNSYVTAVMTAVPSMALVLSWIFNRKPLPSHPADAAYIVFVAAIACSFILNPLSADFKEIALLVLCTLGYPAGRYVNRSHLAGIAEVVFWLSGAIVIVGTIATFVALAKTWDGWRPDVFGFPHTVTVFGFSLAYFSICLINREDRRAFFAASVGLIAIAAFAFAASLVRYSLAVAVMAMVFSFVLAPRRRAAICIAVFAIALMAGFVSRSAQSKVMLAYVVESLGGHGRDVKIGGAVVKPNYLARPDNVTPAQEKMPSCTLRVNMNNSVEIRKMLYLDAMKAIEGISAFGSGFDSFERLGCLRGVKAHNLILQTVVEFGWYAAAAFAFMLFAPIIQLVPAARADDHVRVLLTIFVFMVLIGLAHGSINRELPLFMTAGVLVNITASLTMRRADQLHVGI
jgi:MFS family permease